MRVNLASGRHRREGWVNVDDDPTVTADVHLTPTEFVRRHGADMAAAHVTDVDRMRLEDAAALLGLLADRLPAGAPVSVSYSDCRAAFAAYLDGRLDNLALNGEDGAAGRPRLWWHDAASVCALLEQAGLEDAVTAPPDDGRAEATARVQQTRRSVAPHRQRVPPAERPPAESGGTGAEAAILDRLRVVTAELERARAAEASALKRADSMARVAASPSYRLAVRLSRLGEVVLPAGTARRLVTLRVLRAALGRAEGADGPREG